MGNNRLTIIFISLLLIGVIVMGFINWFRIGKGARNAETSSRQVVTPWEGRPSIYEHIKHHIRPGVTGLAEGGEVLPDEDRIAAEGEIRWAAGAMDGVITHHSDPGEPDKHAEALFKLVMTYSNTPNITQKSVIYDYVLENRALGGIDSFLGLLAGAKKLNYEHLYELGMFLAIEGADREPVKVGLAILGLFRGDDHSEVLHVLGRHDEFTLYCAVALSNAESGADSELWKLAKHVDGWGRIQIVERLAETSDPVIRDWMLHEGYRNSIMHEYLAYICAVTGGLRDAITQSSVEDRTLQAAGELIDALIVGGPAQGMHDYSDGASVVMAYVEQMKDRADKVKDFNVLVRIRNYVAAEDADWESREANGWTKDLRQKLQVECTQVLNADMWREYTINDLESKDEQIFYEADRAARELGIDTWVYHRERIDEKPHDSGRWYNLMQQCDNQRIDEVVALAEKVLPLDEIASGPDDLLGLGEDFQTHSCLVYILQELGAYPGKGTLLIKAGLSSPVISNRNMAINALSVWGKQQWSDSIAEAVQEAVKIEPDENVKSRMRHILAGQPLDES